MNILRDLIDFITTLLNWWFVVEPWEQSVRVRFGKHIRLYETGIYWKIPFFDRLYTQNVRRRVCNVPAQTITTFDGKSMTIHGSLAYRIDDVLKLHLTLHDAQASVCQETLGRVADYVVRHPISECQPEQIVRYVKATLCFEKYGLADVDFFLAGYVADLPTFRLIQDSLTGIQNWGHGSNLDTQCASDNKTAGVPR